MTRIVRLQPMPMDRRTVRRLSLVALVLGALVQAPPAFASCAPPEPLDRMIATSDVVILGTVTAVSNSDRWAQVQVDEIWKGAKSAVTWSPGDPALIVEIRGGPEPGTFSSVDRTFSPGRYLFTLGFDGSHLIDNSCSGTTAWTDAFGGLRPADAVVLTDSPEATGVAIDLNGVVGFLGPALGIALLALLVIGGSWFLSRRAE